MSTKMSTTEALSAALRRLLNSDPTGAIATATDADLQAAVTDGEAEQIVREQAAAVLQARAALAQQAVPQAGGLSDAEIVKIAETLPHAPGENHHSWGCNYYREDERGEFTIPQVPRNVIPFARAILARAGAVEGGR